jgi:hypothetical protein
MPKIKKSSIDGSEKGMKTACFIKGYLPVRLRLPSHLDINRDTDVTAESDTDEHVQNDPIDETFFYVKEHNASSKDKSDDNDDSTIQNIGAILFVANCPLIPNVRSKLLLQSIFGRFGEVTRVTVIPNPKSMNNNHSNRMSSFIEDPYVNEPYRWTDRYAMVPTYCKQNDHGDLIEEFEENGKFAHVVFSSIKEMKRTFRALQEIMSSSSSSSSSSILPAITFDPIEMQTLIDESDRQWRNVLHGSKGQSLFDENDDGDDDDDNDIHQDDSKQSMSAVQIVAQQYRRNCQSYADREQLLQECNRVMETYEEIELFTEQRQREITSKPDADGFITVSYSTKVTTTTEDLESNTSKRSRGTDGRRTSRTKTKKKKKGLGGSQPIPDFYRYQTREYRQKSIQDLRQRFDEDKKRLQQLKEQE